MIKKINCSTKGLIKGSILIVSCKSKELDTNLVYFSGKNECEKFGEYVRKK